MPLPLLRRSLVIEAAQLPPPPADALDHSLRLRARLLSLIRESGGWIAFSRYMHAALYEPGLGYYVAGARKFGEAGDFVTAPELSPHFARCMAVQAAEVLRDGGDILELGPGTGALAAELFSSLEALGCAPRRYRLLEVSPDLRERQREFLAQRHPSTLSRFEWVDGLPEAHRGFIVANEVLDTIACERVGRSSGEVVEWGVVETADGFGWSPRPVVDPERSARFGRLIPEGADYVTECNPGAEALVRAVAQSLAAGLALFVDYGYAASEYYHPQRCLGTLRCHYRHRPHDDPFHLPGLEDITAHVDFTAMAAAAAGTGAAVLGFATQAQFLLSCGLAERLGRLSEPIEQARENAAIQRLVGPGAMGEAFKVLAIGRGAHAPLAGFRLGRPLAL